MPDGRAANQPLSAMTLMPPIGAPLTRRGIQCRAYRFAGEFGHAELIRREVFQHRFLRRGRRSVNPLVERNPQFARQIIEDFAGIPTDTRGDLSGEQSRNDAVLVRRPDRTVAPEERRARALLPAEAE